MNEKGLIEQVLRIINANYSNIYVVDIPMDKVYTFGFNLANLLVIKDTMTYTEFIDMASKFVHKDEVSQYFDALSLNKLESEAQKGNNETKVKYRKLCETGEYRWFVNIINYLPFEGRKLIFMMSEDVNERLIDSEESNLKLEEKVSKYKKRIASESESVSQAVVEINNLLENMQSMDGAIKMRDPQAVINSIFNRVSADHPDLNEAILNKMTSIVNYKKPAILIVDDSAIIRNSLKRIFSNEFDIIMAKDGAEAIELMKNNIVSPKENTVPENIVGVLLDLIMPVCDGFKVLDYMRDHNLFSKLPVAIISGDETRETRKRVYEYDIVDMLEKPFNTENVRRRITKFINLHIMSNNLQNIVDIQNEELDKKAEKNNENVRLIINQIVENILNSKESTRLKKMVRILAINLANKFSKYKLDPHFIDALVTGCPLYNIGAIAMSDDMVITSQSIKQEIDYGLTIIDYTLNDDEVKRVTENIVKYSCEMYDGTGYPDNLKGMDIPIEAQITNIAVRLNQYTQTKSMVTAIKHIIEKDAKRYNPDIITALNDSKKELKGI